MIKIGESASFSKTISEFDVYGFAGIVGDFNSIHINKISAESSVFGKQVAHGMLCASLISTVLGMYLPGEGTVYLGQEIKFLKPVYIGDTLTAKVIVADLLRGGKVKLVTQVINQDNVMVIDGMALVKLPE